MRLIKTLGLGAAAALAAMAFIGTGTASATDTAVCKAPPELGLDGQWHCQTGTKYTGKWQLTGLTIESKVKLLNTMGNVLVECDHAKFHGHIVAENKKVLGEILNFSFETNCHTNIFTCDLLSIVSNVPWEFHLLYLGHTAPQGLLTILKPKTTITLDCALIGEVNCVFANNDNVHGGMDIGNQHLTLKATIKSATGMPCPTEGVLDALFETKVEGATAWVALL
jgi:hypothetical protein